MKFTEQGMPLKGCIRMMKNECKPLAIAWSQVKIMTNDSVKQRKCVTVTCSLYITTSTNIIHFIMQKTLFYGIRSYLVYTIILST